MLKQKEKRSPLFKQRLRRLLVAAKKRWYVTLLLVLALVAATVYSLWPSSEDKVPLSEIRAKISAGQVRSAEIHHDDRTIVAVYKSDGSKHEADYPSEEYGGTLADELEKKDVPYQAVSQSTWGKIGDYLFAFLPMVILFGLYLLLNTKISRRKGVEEVVVPPKERFSDVGANKEVLAELRQLVDGIKNPTLYEEQGLIPLSGVLLYGPPGTGKTLMAKALAGEAGVPFFATSGPDLTAEYANQSAAKIRETFVRANAASEAAGTPVILFVDEIDAVARKRSNRDDSASRDFDATLNQLLSCMDGFKSNGRVIVVAATNRKNVLDPAILRPGRLTLHVLVPLPDRSGRESILRICLRNAPGMELSDEGIDQLVDITNGMSGSGIADLVNGAGREAYRQKEAGKVTWDHFRAAMLNVRLGPARELDNVEKIRAAATEREARRTVVAIALPSITNPLLVCNEVRGERQGITLVADHPEGHPATVDDLLDRITFLVAGRAAEKETGSQTTATTQDIKEATELALKIVCEIDSDALLQWVDPEKWNQHAEATAISHRVSKLLEEAEALAIRIFKQFPEEVQEIRDELEKRGLLEASYLQKFTLQISGETSPEQSFGFGRARN